MATKAENRNERMHRTEPTAAKRRSNNNSKRHRDSSSDDDDVQPDNKASQKNLLNRAGGVYIPPAKLRMLQAQISDKSSEDYQRIAWEALKKTVMGLINKVSVGNLPMVVRDLITENLVRGRGLLARSVIQSQEFSQTFTHVYAALVAVINTKFPEIGELVLKRLVAKFRNSYVRNQKLSCLAATRFIAHLTNQNVVDVVLALQIILKLLKDRTDDSIELAIGFLKECGRKLTDISSRSLHEVFETLRDILQNDGEISKRTQFAIEVLLAIRKGGFQDFPPVLEELDLVEEADQITHDIELDAKIDGEYELDVFRYDADYEENEQKYETIKAEILGGGGGDDDDDNDADNEAGGEGGADSDDENNDNDEAGNKPVIVPGGNNTTGPTGPDQLKPENSATSSKIDKSDAQLISLRRTIYLTIQSSLEYEECAHKMMKLNLPDDQLEEVCHMILDCCAQQRTYEKFYGLLGQRFCLLNMAYAEHFQMIFKLSYDTIHRLETNKLRNVAKFFAHLLHSDSISWLVLGCIKLNEDDTTSAGRIFVKHLTQELAEYMGIPKLNDRIRDATLQAAFDGLFPRDHPRNTRFAINFFTAIGLGALTDDLREWLKTAPKQEPQLPVELQHIREQQELLLKPGHGGGDGAGNESSSSSSSSSSDSSLSSSLSSSSDDDDGDDTRSSISSSVSQRRDRRSGHDSKHGIRPATFRHHREPSPSHRRRTRPDNNDSENRRRHRGDHRSPAARPSTNRDASSRRRRSPRLPPAHEDRQQQQTSRRRRSPSSSGSEAEQRKPTRSENKDERSRRRGSADETDRNAREKPRTSSRHAEEDNGNNRGSNYDRRSKAY